MTIKFQIQERCRIGFDSYIWTSDYLAHDDAVAQTDTREKAETLIDALVRIGWQRDQLRIIEVDA